MAKTNTKKPTAGSSTGLGKPGSMSTWQLALMTAEAVADEHTLYGPCGDCL